MNPGILPYLNSEIHYLDYGAGTTIIIALHGYGETAAAFSCLTSFLTSAYRIIAIDLPYHGKTKWKEPRGCTTADMIVIVDQILVAAGIKATTFILIGYSTGGRIALSITEKLSSRVSRLILLAPDGIKVNFWYWFATRNMLGNHLFRSIVNSPTWFFALIRYSGNLKFINRSRAKFVMHYIGNRDLRSQLFYRWTCLRDIKPNLEKVRSIILKEKLPVELLYGSHDRIILAQTARKFCKGLEEHCTVHIVKAGHNLLQQKHAPVIVSLLSP